MGKCEKRIKEIKKLKEKEIKKIIGKEKGKKVKVEYKKESERTKKGNRKK